MSFLEYNVKTTPSGIRKVLYLNWPLVLLLAAGASFCSTPWLAGISVPGRCRR